MIRGVLSGFLRIYQKFFTLLGYGSCRYYPTCSEYAKWQLEANPNLFKALFLSMVRILRCNQFFDGGIDYPKATMNPTKNSKFPNRKCSVKYWFVPDAHGDRWKIIKNTFSKGHS